MSVVGQEGGRVTPESDVAVNQDVHSAYCGEFSCGDSEHIHTAAETAREKEDIEVSSDRGRQRPEVINTDKDARGIGQGYWEDWPTNCLAGGTARLTFEATTYPRFLACVHANPPVEAMQYFEDASDTEMTEGIRMAWAHYPRSHRCGYRGTQMRTGPVWLATVELRTNSIVSSFPLIRLPLAAR